MLSSSIDLSSNFSLLKAENMTPLLFQLLRRASSMGKTSMLFDRTTWIKESFSLTLNSLLMMRVSTSLKVSHIPLSGSGPAS